jgi:hypothetical protein
MRQLIHRETIGHREWRVFEVSHPAGLKGYFFEMRETLPGKRQSGPLQFDASDCGSQLAAILKMRAAAHMLH